MIAAQTRLQPAVALFRSLADPTRLSIVRRLADSEARVVDLVRDLELPQSTVSTHLACLRDWALSSGVEGLASVIVIWRFTGARTLSETAEGRAQKAVAISFWILAPYVATGSVRDLITQHRADSTLLGIGLTISSILLMPALGIAKQRLGVRLGSGATAGEGMQNLLCAYLAAAVLAGLVTNSLWGWWWLDPIAGLAIAAVAIKEGRAAWRGENCSCAAVPGLSEEACGCVPNCTDGCCAGEVPSIT